MNLTQYQEKKLRELIEISTVLKESHFSVYERFKATGESIREVESQLTSWTRPRPGFTPSLNQAEAEIPKLNAKLRELKEKQVHLSSQLEEMEPEANGASRLAQRLLDFKGLDTDLSPLIKGARLALPSRGA